MAKFYYNGVLLPEIPQDVLAENPYCWIRKNTSSGEYDLCFAPQPWYFSSNMRFQNIDSVTSYRYTVPIATYADVTEWTFANSGTFSYYTVDSSRTVFWSNHDIPNGSATSTTMYFYGSEPSTTTTWKCFETTGGTSLTGTLDVEAGMWVLATVTTRSATTYPSDWKLLHESMALNSDNLNQRMAFLCKKAESDGAVSITITQSSSERIYINLIGIKEISGFKYHEGSEYYTNTKYSQYQMNRPSYKKIIWGLSTPTWVTSSPYGEWTCNEISGKPISLIGNVQRRQANFIDEVPSGTRLFKSNNGGSDYAAIIDYVEVITEKSSYLFRSNGELYTVVDGALFKINAQLNSSTFETYGINSVEDWNIIKNLESPDVLYWTENADAALSKATLTALPNPQSIITNSIDLTHPTIIGINSITGECSGSPLFSCEFNGVWKEHDGIAWVDSTSGMTYEALSTITPEQWDEITTDLDSFKIKVILDSADDKVVNLKVNYNFDITQAVTTNNEEVVSDV